MSLRTADDAVLADAVLADAVLADAVLAVSRCRISRFVLEFLTLNVHQWKFFHDIVQHLSKLYSYTEQK